MQDSILNATVSAFRDYNTPEGPQPVSLLQWLTSAKYADRVAAIRTESNKAARDATKATLPAITPSGLFTYRAAKRLVQHSGFIQFDIDFKENSRLTNYGELKAQLCKIVNVAYCGLSVSGTGFWGLIPIADTDKHQQHFDFIYKAFQRIGITLDKKPRNVAALRGYSYDADAYFNHRATPLTQYYAPQQKASKGRVYNNTGDTMQAQVESLINQINQKRIDIAPNYDQWLEVGFAFASEFGKAGCSYFHDVSALYPGYDEDETDEQYTKCLSSGGSGITIKTFFYLCKAAGVTLPEGAKTEKKKAETTDIKKTLQLSSSRIACLPSSHQTGIEFGSILIQGVKTKEGGFYDLIYSADGELIKPGEKNVAVNRLAGFFEKRLQPAELDGHPCLIHIYN